MPLKTRLNGNRYESDNRVKDIRVKDGCIFSRVQGSSSDDYDVEISLKANQVVSKCSCPVRLNCKHVAASITAYLSIDQKEEKKDQKAITFSKPRNSKDDDIEHVGVKQWIKEISSSKIIEDESPLEKIDVNNDRTLIFVLDFKKGYPNLSLSSCKIKKKGGYSKTNQLYVNLQNLWDHSAVGAKTYFTDSDWNIIHHLQKKVLNEPSFSGINLSFSGSGMILKEIIETRKCFVYENYDYPIVWGAPFLGEFEWEVQLEKNVQVLEIFLGENKIALKGLDPVCYFDESQNMIGFVDFKEDKQTVKIMLQAPPIPLNEVNKVRSVLSKTAPSLVKLAPAEVSEKLIDVKPTPILKLFLGKFLQNVSYWGDPIIYQAIGAKVFFKYSDYCVALNQNQNPALKQQFTLVGKDGKLIKINRDLQIEHKFKSTLHSFNWIECDRPLSLQDLDFMLNPLRGDKGALKQAAFVLQEIVPLLEKKGWSIEIDASFPIKGIYVADEFLLDTNEKLEGASSDWFEVKLGVLIEGERVNILPVLKHIVEKINKTGVFENSETDEYFTVYTSDGKLIKLPQTRLLNLAQHLMLEFSNPESKKLDQLRLSKWNAGFLSEFVRAESVAKSRWVGSEKLKAFAEAIKEGVAYEEILPPKGLKCELRPYQRQGLDWLQFLFRCQLNGMLADDMGLGKTVQTLAHILLEKESGRMKLPVLIIAPTSLMPNWLNEASRLAPDLRVLILQGNDRRLNFAKIGEYDVILTTYPLLNRDKEFLVAQQFHLLILDEAQAVKNYKTLAYQVVQQIQSNQRICLSGTPMENHLGELWSLFHLLLPGFLGDQKTFQSIYRKPIEKEGNIQRRESLAKRIKPFILRRTKQQVALELPEKTEIIQKIELKDKQRNLYEAIRLRAQSKVMREVEKKGLAASQIIVLDALLKLRQVCCDPRLLKTEDQIKFDESAKLEWLLEVLPQMIEENRKILLFSQFTSMLALIEEALNQQKISFAILTGQTKDRHTPVNDFQSGKVPIMLVSLKAGGVGLNLTAADTVIHYDPWWNPSVENQATDRAHRIGQKRAVFVYKLVVSGSLEEKILDLQDRKKGLIASMLNDENVIGRQFSMKDLEDIFKPLPQSS